MKQLLPFLLIVLCHACGNPTLEEIPYTIIKGKITNLPLSKNRITGRDSTEIIQKRKEINLVSNAMRFGLDVPNHQALTDDEGNYQFLIKIEKPTEVRLQYGRPINLPLYVRPGDEIIVDIDYHNQLSPNQSPCQISGDNAELNQQIANYDQLFRDSFAVELRATLPYVIPREFKEQRAKITKRIRRLTNEFIEEKAKNSPVLANWVKHHSEYRIAMDYMKYAFKRYHFNNFSPLLKEGFPISYFDFWEDFPVNNTSAINSLNYQNYLQLFRRYLMAKLAQTKPYQDCKKFPNCNYFELEIDELKQYFKNKTLDLSLAQQIDNHLVRNNQGFLKNGLPQYLASIKDSLLLQQIAQRKNYLYEERAFKYPPDATFYQSNGTGEELLSQISQAHQARPTILYFWNTQTEITWSFIQKAEVQKVWKVLDTLNFDLVLLAHHSTPNQWKETILKKGYIQEQWHLTDKQYDFFQDYFQQERKKHVFYDKIRDYENFVLGLDEAGNLYTPELSFRTLNSLAALIKWKATKDGVLKAISF